MTTSLQNRIPESHMLRLQGWVVVLLADKSLLLSAEDREALEALREPDEAYTEQQAELITELWKWREKKRLSAITTEPTVQQAESFAQSTTDAECTPSGRLDDEPGLVNSTASQGPSRRKPENLFDDNIPGLVPLKEMPAYHEKVRLLLQTDKLPLGKYDIEYLERLRNMTYRKRFIITEANRVDYFYAELESKLRKEKKHGND